MTARVRHARVTGAPSDPSALVDGPAWDQDHIIEGFSPSYLTYIQTFGGNDDGVTFNDAALASAMLEVATTTKLLWFPKIGNGIYAFNPNGAGVNLGGIWVGADPGVVFKGPIFFDPSSKVVSDITAQYQDGTGFIFNGFGFSPKFNRPVREKEAWLSVGDLERRTITGYDMTTLGCATTDFTTGDTWTTDASVTVTADSVTVNLSNDGKVRGAQIVPVRGGDEVGISFWPGSYVRCAFIRFAGGWLAFYANNSNGVVRTKLIGVAASDTSALSWFGLGTNPAWSPNTADWKIRIYDSRTYSILLNGMEIIERSTAPGVISDAGFGMMGVSTFTASMSYLSKVRRTEAAGRSPARILVVGDSTSADIAAGWPYYMKEMLEGSFGIRVWDVFNQAVAGNTSTQQLTALNANDAQLTQSTHVVIHVGINDDQSSGPATTLSNISSMIDRCVSRGVNLSHIVVCIPYLWYTKTLAGGIVGFNAGANDAHWLLRAGIRRLVGIKGCRLVELSEVLAAVQPDDLAVVGRDPQLRDNIHPTIYSYRKIGYAIARELANGTAAEMTQKETVTQFHTSWLKNSWTLTSTLEASYSVTKEGLVSLSGSLMKGTVSAGVVVATLPVNMRPPQYARQFACLSDSGAVVITYVNTDGTIQLGNFSGSDTYIFLSGISFQLSN